MSGGDELEGCAVMDGDYRVGGVVSRLLELPSCEALEVRRNQMSRIRHSHRERAAGADGA